MNTHAYEQEIFVNATNFFQKFTISEFNKIINNGDKNDQWRKFPFYNFYYKIILLYTTQINSRFVFL